jgi:hypothetical protein
VTETAQVPLEAIAPSFEDILRGQGIPPQAAVNDRVRALVETSLGILAAEARPCSITGEVSRSEFDEIFRGQGHNEAEAPLKGIYPQARHLVLFALTMGPGPGERIEGFLKHNDFALAAMLDTAASLAVENFVGLLERRVAERFAGNGAAAADSVVLNYSPGYCGWHISAQNQVFRYLDPGQIGITLNDSQLMTPLKSATGVLVHGQRAIHDFDIGFRFCRACRDKTCLDRRDRLSSVSHPTLEGAAWRS